MLENGFIKLHRRILQWEWYDEPNTYRLFLHLLLTVNVQDTQWHGMAVPRGARIASFTALATELRLSVKQIRVALAHLEQTGEVAHRSYRHFSVFSVVRFELYQGVGHAKGTRGATEEER